MTGWGGSTHAARVRRGASPHVARLLLLVAWAPAPAAAQAVRGWVGTTVQMVELRPLGQDTVPRADVLTTADGRYLYNGQLVSCVLADRCTGYIALAKDQVLAATQDVSLTAWGFGVEGLSFTTLLRARAHAGSDLVWPRSGDAFDAMLAYAQLVRGPYRFRVGRQELRSGLGFSGFDGASASWVRGAYQVEGYAGRSLARGLREPASEALRSLEDFFFDEGVVLLGASARARFHGTALTARYHREILRDRSSLVGERASVDFGTVVPRVRVSGAMDYDFSFQQVGKSHLTLGVPVLDGRLLLEATARRYTPYFQLSTIWGFFDPVSYSEVELRAGWSPRTTLGVWASGGRRAYGDTDTNVIFEPLSDSGWRANAGARWQPAAAWTVDGAYRLEWGPGGFLNSFDAGARYSASERLSVSATATTFQQIDEFRVGEGRAFGGGLSFDVELTRRASLAGGVSVLRHRDGGNSFTSPWNQTRAWSSLRVAVGEDPGLANRRTGR